LNSIVLEVVAAGKVPGATGISLNKCNLKTTSRVCKFVRGATVTGVGICLCFAYARNVNKNRAKRKQIPVVIVTAPAP
jgi:hypothetical protein